MARSETLDAAICNRARLARDPRFDGRFFIAVRSTGIYCRPICPSPTAKRENVRFFATAAEAVSAGYRPCLRCRPEAAPGTAAWNGTSTTVSRALRLIADGALQDDGVAKLSERLGVSARHLDRLFRMHLGASPAAVAKTARLQFAKQLISDTDLPMFRVALASGFGSVRRFNDSIRDLYGRSPSELRRMRVATRSRSGKAATRSRSGKAAMRARRGKAAIRSRSDEYVFRLPYRPPYDWDSLLAFLAARAIPGVEEVAAGAYRRSFSLGGTHGILEVRHEALANSLEARVRFPEPVSLLPIVTRLRAMFDLAADPAPIAEHFRRDLLLGRLVEKYPGLRVPGAWDGFELAVRAILGQQVSVSAASTLAGRIAQSLGEPLSIPDGDHSNGGGLTFVFPDAGAVAAAGLPGMPEVRASAIRTLASAVASGRIAFSGSDGGAADGLKRIRGIGEWTEQYIAMRAGNEPDAFPVQDLVLMRVAGRGVPLTAADLRARAEAWRPWRAYAAILLWRSAADAPFAAESRARSAGSRARGPATRRAALRQSGG